MKSSRRTVLAAVRLFVVCAGVAAAAAATVAGRAIGATDTPFEKMSIDDRLKNAPDSTVVHLGTGTTTLGAMRAAHAAREAALSQAGALGLAAQGKMTTVVGLTTVTVGGLRAVDVGGTPPPKPVVEPQSDYASAPADMKAFCKAAAASACLYFPPGNTMYTNGNIAFEEDMLVTQSQCTQEGGGWYQGYVGFYCQYNYPAVVVVHFAPAANYKFTQSAHCDKNIFSYTVDDHGAIQITANVAGLGTTTGDDASCLVTVIPGA
jgi:hypothetical protein